MNGKFLERERRQGSSKEGTGKSGCAEKAEGLSTWTFRAPELLGSSVGRALSGLQALSQGLEIREGKGDHPALLKELLNRGERQRHPRTASLCVPRDAGGLARAPSPASVAL